MYSQGVSPNLDFSDLPAVRDLVEKCTAMPCPDRYPYAGKLVFAAFAGTHQDAIKKGLEAREKKEKNGEKAIWAIPYLPIDPNDIGCSYDAIIRVNSQSGRAGAAYMVKTELLLDLPRPLQAHFGKVIQRESERAGKELTSKFITECFRRTYHLGTTTETRGRLFLSRFQLSTARTSSVDSGSDTESIEDSPIADTIDFATAFGIDVADAEVVVFEGELLVDGSAHCISGTGSSPISAALQALRSTFSLEVDVKSLSTHAMPTKHSKTACYLELARCASTVGNFFGVGVSSSPAGSCLRALISSINSALPEGYSFSKPRRPGPSFANRTISGSSFRVEELVLRTGAPPRGIGPNEWRHGVEA